MGNGKLFGHLTGTLIIHLFLGAGFAFAFLGAAFAMALTGLGALGAAALGAVALALGAMSGVRCAFLTRSELQLCDERGKLQLYDGLGFRV